MTPSLPRASVPAPIAAALARGAHVLTANARAARALSRAFAEDMRASGQRSWRAPAIRDWTGWLEEVYETLAETLAENTELPPLLTALQEELVWTRVQSADAALVVSPDRLAQLAQSGYRLLSAYDAHSSRRASWAAAHEDAEHFLGWARAFDALCKQLGVLPRAELEATLGQHVASLDCAMPRELLLVGFDRLTPAQQRLLQALRQTGVAVAQAAAGEPAPSQQLVCAADEQQELRACALWVRARLEQDPAQRIAVLAPELRGARAQIDRVFRRVLLPHSARQAAPGPVPYEFSLGTPLASVPLIASALLLLRWLAGPLPAAEITSLFTGGFVAVDEREAEALAQGDAALRKAGLLTTELNMGALLRHAEARRSPPGFLARLRAADSWAHRETRRRGYAEWADAVETQLATLGWPGFRELDSLAYQARERWDALLVEVARLGFAGDLVSWSEFVRQLAEAARNTLFAAASRNAPVQILGAAEASGQSFDALWFLQMTEARSPAGGRLHPLLAPALQRDAGMPHTSADADLLLAEEQLRRIVASAPVVVCSYARQSGGVEARPSPLLRGFAAGAPPVEAAAPAPSTLCETVREPEPPMLAPWPLDRVAGGSEVLKRQAACGFQSFAVKRLAADALEEEAWGLDARDRATLLHASLEALWSAQPVPPDASRLHSRTDLLRAIDDGSLVEKVQAAIATAFRAATGSASADAFRAAYLELEQERLRTRLLWWLEVEQERAPFRVVGLEKKIASAPIPFPAAFAGGLPAAALLLNLRADRIDEIDEVDEVGEVDPPGERAAAPRLILDYKTADQVSPALWAGERPDEPQLPIYALFGGIERVAGVAFAQIRAGQTKLHALAEDPAAQLGGPPPKSGARHQEGATPDKRLLLHETRAEWDRALRALAGQFARGEAPVNPKHGEQTCRFCGLYGVCRVRSRQGGAPLALDEDDDDA